MINLPYNTCFGCYGCQNICPKEAISLIPDEYGYKHPQIDKAKCIECHLCEKVCTSLNPLTLNTAKKIFAAIEKDAIEHATVASGGFCSVVSREIINGRGIVYGCSEGNYKNIRHIRIDKTPEIDLLKKSKYVFSDINSTLQSVKKDLTDGKKVLFIGTPCQVSGLYGFLQKTYDNLFTIDLVCHGVPSQKMLIQHIDSLPRLKNLDKSNGFVDFRWKTAYGIRYGIRFGIDGHNLYEESGNSDAYMAAFTCGISYRENCYTCPFAKGKRVGDITAADFWGVGSLVDSKFKDVNGVSLIMVNSDKGNALFETIMDKFDLEVHTLEEAQRNNGNLSHPSIRPEDRDKFLNLFVSRGMSVAAKECIPIYKKFSNPIYKFLISIPGLVPLYLGIKKTVKLIKN